MHFDATARLSKYITKGNQRVYRKRMYWIGSRYFSKYMDFPAKGGTISKLYIKFETSKAPKPGQNGFMQCMELCIGDHLGHNIQAWNWVRLIAVRSQKVLAVCHWTICLLSSKSASVERDTRNFIVYRCIVSDAAIQKAIVCYMSNQPSKVTNLSTMLCLIRRSSSFRL